MTAPKGVRKVSELITQVGRAVVITEEDDSKLDWSQIPDGTLKVNPVNGIMSVKLKDQTTWAPAGLKNDGTICIAKDSKINIEVFTVKTLNGDGTFTYTNTEGENRTKPLTADGKLMFELEKGTYINKRNALEGFINNDKYVSTPDGSLIEIDEMRFALASMYPIGTKVAARYIQRFNIGNPYPRVFENNDQPTVQEFGDWWLDLDADPDDPDVTTPGPDTPEVSWDHIIGRPTTLDGYGIVDGAYKNHRHKLSDIDGAELLGTGSGSGDVNAEVIARQNADSILQSSVNDEVNARTAADTTLQNNITSEANTRKSADDNLQAALNTEIANRENEDAAEMSARIAGDNALQSQINAVKNEVSAGVGDIVTNATASIDAIKADLAQEKVDRANADTNLQNQINAINPAAIDAKFTQEATDRANADNALDAKITQATADRKSLWEHYHKFDDLSFYDTLDVLQSGQSTANMVAKSNKLIWGDPDKYNIKGSTVENPGHPFWIKHQQVFTTSDGIKRLFLGCAMTNGSAVFMSDDNGENFTLVNLNTAKVGVWDMAEFNGYLYALHWSYPTNTIARTQDGITWEDVAVDQNAGSGYVKDLVVFKGKLYSVGIGNSYVSADGTTWTEVANNVTGGQVYSRAVSGNYLYVGTTGEPITLFRTTDGSTWETVWSGSGHAYLRWITTWTPKNSTTEYVVFGTGGSGNEAGTAQLYCYDPVANTNTLLFDFKTGTGSVNDGKAIIEPRDATGTPIGFRERQIRYIQVFENDYTGENFLMIGTSDDHLYSELNGTQVYYKNGTLWTSDDINQWMGEHVVLDSGSPSTYMGNIYAVGPRSATDPFALNDLVISLIKHTSDTRVYSMSVFPDINGKKWLYCGTGGGNYNGKGLLYKMSYSDVLDIIQATKQGAILPPEWQLDGTLNKRLTQISSNSLLKLVGGASSKEQFAEARYGLIYNAITASDVNFPPYFGVAVDYQDAANYFEVQHQPTLNKVVVYDVTNNVKTLKADIAVDAYATYATTDGDEAIKAPKMGPYYILAAKIQGTTLKVYFKQSQYRTDRIKETDLVATIDVTGLDKTGRYCFSVFDVKGASLINMKQQSIDAYNDNIVAGGMKYGL